MRMQLFLLITWVLVGTSCGPGISHPQSLTWDAGTRTFAWPGGEVKVPPGFTYHGGEGLDTLEGHFSSPDGKLAIRYDIGAFAGAYANARDASSFREHFVLGTRVWVATRPAPSIGSTSRVAVTFPDSGCANFFVHSNRPEDAELIAQIAQSYHPHIRQDSGTGGSCMGGSSNNAKK